MSLTWEIKRVGSNAYKVMRAGIDMLPIHVDLAYAKHFVHHSRTPTDRVCVTDGSGTRYITKEFTRKSARQRQKTSTD